jgi:ketosteroid isomerase-like protein
MNTIALALAATAALTLSHCKMGEEHHTKDPGKIAAAIKAKEAQWQKDYAAKDVNALAAQYRDDAAMAGPGDPLATTDADRRKILQALVSDPNFALTFSTNRILVAKSGDLASSRGNFTLTMTDKATKKPATVSGSYLTVYKLQDDGSWKAVEDFITPGPAAAPEAAAQ